MTYYFTRVNNKIAYVYSGKNEKRNGISTRVEEKSIGRLDELERYIFKRQDKTAKITVQEYGLTSTLLSIANKLNITTGFQELIKTKKNKKDLSTALMLIVLYNICHKGGKLSLKSWYQKTNLSEIYPIDLEQLDVYNLCRDMDLLEPYISAVEKLICFNILALDCEELDILYFDMTNQYVYVDNNDSLLLKNGHSKAKRYDLKQFSLALTASAKSGIPLFHKVYAGNITDVTFFGDYIDELTKKIKETGSEPKGKLLIFDKGNNSKDNITKVMGLNYNFIGALKPSSYKELISTPTLDLVDSVKINGNKVVYKELKMNIYGTEMKVVITFDENTNKKKQHTFENYLSRLQQKVKEFQEHVNLQLIKDRKSKWSVAENIIENAKYFVAKEYSKLFEFEVNYIENQVKIEVKIISEEYDELQLKFGKNLLFTNKLELDAKEIIRLYREKDLIEKLFAYIKNFKLIQLEPQYHHLDNRIITNTYLKVISLQILAYLNKTLTEKHISIGIFEAVEELKSIYNVNYVNYETGMVREIPVQINEKQKELIDKLELNMRY